MAVGSKLYDDDMRRFVGGKTNSVVYFSFSKVTMSPLYYIELCYAPLDKGF